MERQALENTELFKELQEINEKLKKLENSEEIKELKKLKKVKKLEFKKLKNNIAEPSIENYGNNYLHKKNIDKQYKVLKQQTENYYKKVQCYINIINKKNEIYKQYVKKKKNKLKIRIFIGYILKIQTGDKLTGRYGNKGTIAKFVKNIDMLFLPDGKTIDILFNPLGIPSRMNIGQIFECILGFIYEKLNKRFYIIPFTKTYFYEPSRFIIIKKLTSLSLYKKESWLSSLISNLGKIRIQNGRTGRFLNNPITVGISYILKLLHISQDKLHIRNIGKYDLVMEQPIHNKELHGGQRFGEMEFWSLEAYGCSYTIQEFLTIKADDILGRKNLHLNSFTYKAKRKIIPYITDGCLKLIRQLNILGFDLQFINISQNNYINYKSLTYSIFNQIYSKLLIKSGELNVKDKLYSL